MHNSCSRRPVRQSIERQYAERKRIVRARPERVHIFAPITVPWSIGGEQAASIPGSVFIEMGAR